LEGGLAPAARYAGYRGPCPRGSLRDRSPAAFGVLALLAARYATAPPPPSACSRAWKGALPPRLATRPLPRRLRRARFARGPLCAARL